MERSSRVFSGRFRPGWIFARRWRSKVRTVLSTPFGPGTARADEMTRARCAVGEHSIVVEGAIGDLHALRAATRLDRRDDLAAVLGGRALDRDLAQGRVPARLNGVHGDDGAARAVDRGRDPP